VNEASAPAGGHEGGATPRTEPRHAPSTCPYCHDTILPEHDVIVCRECNALHHGACWREMSACATCRSTTGLGALASSSPAAAERPPFSSAPLARVTSGPSRAIGAAPRDEGPRRLHCPVCRRDTTHVGSRCTRCLARGDNRKQGTLWVVLGVAMISLAAGGLVVAWSLRARALAQTLRWNLPDNDMGHYWPLELLLGIVIAAGALIVVRGARAIVSGGNPDGTS
jgi:hypothetical protein